MSRFLFALYPNLINLDNTLSYTAKLLRVRIEKREAGNIQKWANLSFCEINCEFSSRNTPFDFQASDQTDPDINYLWFDYGRLETPTT